MTTTMERFLAKREDDIAERIDAHVNAARPALVAECCWGCVAAGAANPKCWAHTPLARAMERIRRITEV